jgi:hypothetical protein
MLQLYHSEGSQKRIHPNVDILGLAGYTQNSLPSSKHWHCKIVGRVRNF